MRSLLKRPSPATVLASLALLVALAGTGYAATVLPANSVGTAQLKPNAVNSAKVKNGSLLKADFKSGQLPAGPPGPAGAPGAAGAAGPAGPAGPSDAFSGFKNGPVAVPNTLATIATLTVPTAGKYVVFGKLYLFDNQNTAVFVPCRLVAGSDFDETGVVLEGNSGVVVNSQSVALNVVHEFTAAGTVELRCNAAGVNVNANFIKITAIKVGNLTNSGI